jgi:hypothetical protein
MLTVFLSGERLLVLEALLKGRKLNQNYFLQSVLSAITNSKRRYCQENRGADCCVHMDNATPHNGARVASIMDRQHVLRTPHPPYSPDISLCDFSLFGAVKHTMKDIELNFTEQIVTIAAKVSADLTFEDVQRVFEEWITPLEWVTANGGEYFIK